MLGASHHRTTALARPVFYQHRRGSSGPNQLSQQASFAYEQANTTTYVLAH